MITSISRDPANNTVISALGTAVSFALSSQVVNVQLLFVIWALVGFFASTMTCLGMRILSDLPNKVRAFGIRQGVELSVTAAVLFALPPLVIAYFKYPGAALALERHATSKLPESLVGDSGAIEAVVVTGAVRSVMTSASASAP